MSTTVRETAHRDKRPHDLYRFYDTDGQLLYIGISFSAIQRAAQHRDAQPWWSDVARMDIEHLGTTTRRNAEQLERAAIAAESPRHNIAHNMKSVPKFWHRDDMCDQCAAPSSPAYVRPDKEQPGWLYALYVCNDCRRSWLTWWAA
jgi:hypothetical protein